MADKVDLNTVIEQLVGRIAQLELEVAVLNAILESKSKKELGIIPEAEDEMDGGYM